MEEFAPDLLTLTDDEGVEMEFQILDQIDTDEGHFLALLPVEEADDEDENGSYYILKEEEDEDGEPMLAEVEDEELLDRLAEIFQAHVDEMYGEDEE